MPYVMQRGRMVSIEDPECPQTELFHKEDSRQIWVSTPTTMSVMKEGTQTDLYSLPFFATYLQATILEDTITQLRWLEELNTKLRIIRTMVDLDLLRALKYGVEQPAVTDELEGVDPKDLKKEQYKLVKLAHDRKMVCDILLEVYSDLTLQWNYRPLHDCVEKARLLKIYQEQLKVDNAHLKITRKELFKQIRHQRNSIKSAYYETDGTIEYLKTQVEDLVMEEECRSRYAGGWQNARKEQLLEEIRQKESQPYKSLRHYKRMLDDEQRVHSEIEMLGIIQINEKSEEVESWMNKYDVDMEAVDLKIEIQKNEYNVTHEQRLELEETLKTHAELMKNWIEFKADREAKRLYELKMNRAAIVLQAWWRGLLVRKALGPYKVKGRPAGGGAKKGKKK